MVYSLGEVVEGAGTVGTVGSSGTTMGSTRRGVVVPGTVRRGSDVVADKRGIAR
jgi:hypothetical protein